MLAVYASVSFTYVILAPGDVELTRYVSWPDGVNADLNQALVLLGLVLYMFVVFHQLLFRFVMF